MPNAYDSLYTGQHNDGYEPRITALTEQSTTFTAQISTLQASTTAISTTASYIKSSRVAKAGDIMTGSLQLQSTSVTSGVVPAESVYGKSVRFSDSTENELARIRLYSFTTGEQGLEVYVKKSIDDTSYSNYIRLGIDNEGNRKIHLSDGSESSWKSELKIGSAYDMKKWGTITLNSSTTATSQTISLTTNGRPVFLIVNGDINPGAAESTWMRIEFKRDSTTLCSRIVQSNASSCNNPFTLSYLDVVAAGTYTYTAALTRGAGTVGLSEEGALQSPQFIAFEI